MGILKFMGVWKGIRHIFTDLFDSEIDQDLTAAGWTKINGSAVIREDGSGKAYSTSAGFSPNNICVYTPDGVSVGNVSQNYHWLSCDVVLCAHNNVYLEIYHSVRYAAGRRTAVWVEVFRNQSTGVWTFNWNFEYNAGGVTSTSIGTISEGKNPPPYTVLIRRHDLLYDIDIGPGPLVGGDGLITLNDAAGTSFTYLGKPGLGYIGPAFGLGAHEAEWAKFIVRKYAK